VVERFLVWFPRDFNTFRLRQEHSISDKFTQPTKNYIETTDYKGRSRKL